MYMSFLAVGPGLVTLLQPHTQPVTMCRGKTPMILGKSFTVAQTARSMCLSKFYIKDVEAYLSLSSALSTMDFGLHQGEQLLLDGRIKFAANSHEDRNSFLIVSCLLSVFC